MHRMDKLRGFGMAKHLFESFQTFMQLADSRGFETPCLETSCQGNERCFLCLWFGCFQKSISGELVLDHM